MSCNLTNCQGGCGICKSHKDKLPGGLADNKKPGDFDREALAEGVGVESEHTSDADLAVEIAMDHLTEDPEYYKKLKTIEKAQSVNWHKKGKSKIVRQVKFQGLKLSIETDKGQYRHWFDPHVGREGKTKMTYPYGYIQRTDGADGEQIDVYINEHNPDSEKVFIVHQKKAPDFEEYDEDKVMLGFESSREAKAAYLGNFDSPKFFGSMTQTDIESFKRIFVKSFNDMRLEESLRKGFALAEDEEIQKGLLDQLKKLWGKIKAKFSTPKTELYKTWTRQGEAECRTGICPRLDGTSLPVDGMFRSYNGMEIPGPPAHTNCKCVLKFEERVKKAMEPGFKPEEPDPALQPQQPMVQPMMPQQPMMGPMGMPMMPPPEDVETYEGVNQILGRMGSIKDQELMEIASKIWGDGYNYEGKSPAQARVEILGFLLDQRDLLGVAPAEPVMPSLDPSPSLPVKEPHGSSDYSSVSQALSTESPVPSPEESLPDEMSPNSPSMPSLEPDSLRRPNPQEESENMS